MSGRPPLPSADGGAATSSRADFSNLASGDSRPRLGRFQPRLFLLLRLLGVPRDASSRVAASLAAAGQSPSRACSIAGRRDDVPGRTRVPARIEPRGVDADVSIRYRRSRRVASRRERRDAMRHPRVGRRRATRTTAYPPRTPTLPNAARTSETVYSDATLLGVARRARRGHGHRGAPRRNRGGRREIRTVPRRGETRRVATRVRRRRFERGTNPGVVDRPRRVTRDGDDSVGEVRVTVDVRDGRCRVRRRRRRHRERRPRRRRRAVPNPPGEGVRGVFRASWGPEVDARARVEPGRRRRSRSTRRVRLRGSNGPGARRLVGDHDVRSRRGKGTTRRPGDATRVKKPNRARRRPRRRARDDGVRARRRGV